MLALAGYAGYVIYPRFDLPAVTGVGLLILAASAGIASFFSPCSFPLLVTLLARETNAAKTEGAVIRALGFALALSMGVIFFLLLAGGAIAIGGGPIFEGVTFTSVAGRAIRLLVGAVLVLLGLGQSSLLRTFSFAKVGEAVKPLEQTRARLEKIHPMAGFFLYGFGYILAGFG